MINVNLTWQQAAFLTGGLAASAAWLRHKAGSAQRRRLGIAAGVVREAALICALFTLWQFAGSATLFGHDGAFARGRWLWQAERALHLPDEASLQAAFLAHPLIVWIGNLYYDILHFPALIGVMVWLFVWHRDRYPRFRTTLAAFTGVCLLIQLIPVAPPRLLPETSMVDTALRYGQSVYAPRAGFEANQFSAMPSVHVGWAILVAIGIIGTARTRWRWLAVIYPLLTSVVVVVTANHYWLDGIASAVIIVVVLLVQAAISRQLAQHVRASRAACRSRRVAGESRLRPSTCSIWRSRW